MSVTPPPTGQDGAPPDGAAVPVPDPSDLDEATYLCTAEMLPREDLERHMRALIVRAGAVLARLRGPGMPAEAAAVAELAHALGGSGSMFGLHRLADAARDFEHAVLTAPAELTARAAELAAAAQTAMGILQDLVDAMAAEAAKR